MRVSFPVSSFLMRTSPFRLKGKYNWIPPPPSVTRQSHIFSIYSLYIKQILRLSLRIALILDLLFSLHMNDSLSYIKINTGRPSGASFRIQGDMIALVYFLPIAIFLQNSTPSKLICHQSQTLEHRSVFSPLFHSIVPPQRYRYQLQPTMKYLNSSIQLRHLSI